MYIPVTVPLTANHNPGSSPSNPSTSPSSSASSLFTSSKVALSLPASLSSLQVATPPLQCAVPLLLLATGLYSLRRRWAMSFSSSQSPRRPPRMALVTACMLLAAACFVADASPGLMSYSLLSAGWCLIQALTVVLVLPVVGGGVWQRRSWVAAALWDALVSYHAVSTSASMPPARLTLLAARVLLLTTVAVTLSLARVHHLASGSNDGHVKVKDSEHVPVEASRFNFHFNLSSKLSSVGSSIRSVFSMVRRTPASLAQYRVLLPFFWPSEDKKLQLAMVGVGICIAIERALNVLIPASFGSLVDKISGGKFPVHELVGLAVFTWMRSWAGISALKHVLIRRVANWSHRKVSMAAFAHVVGLSVDYQDSKDTGDTIRSMEQATCLKNLMELVCIDSGPVAVDLIVGAAYIAYLVDGACALTMVVTCIAYVWATAKLTPWTSKHRAVTAERSRNTFKHLYAAVSSWYTITYFGRQDHEQTRYAAAVDSELAASVSYENTTFTITAVQDLIMVTGRIVATSIAAYLVFGGSRLVGTLVTLNVFWTSIDSPLWTLAKSYRRFNAILVDAQRLIELLEQRACVTDGPAELAVTKGRVEFQAVDHFYDARKQTLSKVNFVAEPGQTIALVGETGSGKSTILKLLLRFFDPASGSIHIDGQDIRNVSLNSLRGAYGIVPQDPSMFNNTILENIRYARLEATDEEVLQACKEAVIHEKIMSFPDGYQTMVGENGVKLSGGELQRIAIARVILRRPRIILLDEATSAVDTMVEKRIQATLDRVCTGCTTFMVAHRLSTVVKADQIFVINQGKIVERGSHLELLRIAGGKYKQLWQMQTDAALMDGEEDMPATTQLAPLATAVPKAIDSQSLFSPVFTFGGSNSNSSNANMQPMSMEELVAPEVNMLEAPKTERHDSLGDGLVTVVSEAPLDV